MTRGQLTKSPVRVSNRAVNHNEGFSISPTSSKGNKVKTSRGTIKVKFIGTTNVSTGDFSRGRKKGPPPTRKDRFIPRRGLEDEPPKRTTRGRNKRKGGRPSQRRSQFKAAFG